MKKLLVVLGLIAAVSSAQASYLYWQLTGGEAEGNTFTHAILWAKTNKAGETPSYGTAQENSVVLGGTTYDAGVVVQNWDSGSVGAYVVDVSSYGEGSSFYIELKNYDSATAVYKTVGFLQDVMYRDLVQNNYIDTGLSVTPAAVWHGGAFAPTPEPTSAVLVLLGLAGLALKRRAV